MAAERRLGGYRLVAPLATGGMAELFVAKTAGVSGFEKQVALKVIHPNYSSDPEFVRMLVDEAKLAVQLQHANIVQTYDLGQVDGQYYIAMELIDGADLYKVLKTASERGLDFPIDVAAFVASEVSSGLDYAHRKNDPQGRPLKIVHRDVSPQNVLISFEGEIKIVDFGIAKAAMRGQQTQAGVIKGKYFYMSPEQAWGDKIDARTDVFSTGILLHEMLVGEMLYLEEDLEKLLKMVRAAEIQPPSRKRADVPPELDAIVMKALAKRPEDRYQSSSDLATALTRFLRTAFPDFGRSRAALFVREVLEREHSRADITPPPPTPDEFGDENSLIFDLKNNRRLNPREAHRAADAARRKDEATRGISMPVRPLPAGDYDDAGATEFDPKPNLSLRERGTDPDMGQQAGRAAARGAPADFLDASDESEPTEFSRGTRRPPPRQAPGFDGADDEESTHQRQASPSAGRRPSQAPAPVASARRATLPPVASPPPPPRAALGLGVSEPERRPTPQPTRPPSGERPREEGAPKPPAVAAPMASAPMPGGTGATPLVDWNVAPTVTPSTATPYAPSSGAFEDPSAVRRLPDLKRRKIMLLVGVALLVLVLVLTVVLLWPDGPQRGSIEVVSSPAGATVRIDGTVLSKLTPIRISDVDLRQPHHLAVSLRGYDTWESDAKFDQGEREIRLQAVLVPAVGTLEIATTPPGAEAIVNGRISGTTPTRVGDLPPNEDVTLELRLRGYKVVYRTLPWNGKRALSVSVPLEKAR